MAQPKKTLYQILGISQDATSIDIGLAHEKISAELQRTVPPDPSGVALVQQAYEILSSPQRRAAYDASLVTAAEKAAAAAQQGAPDLELELEVGEDDGRARRMRLMGMVGGMALVLVALFFVFRPRAVPPAAPVEPVVEAPKPPPPPRNRTAAEVLHDASTSGGQVFSYSMSGTATPLGLAMEIDQNQMVTPCHAIPAGSKLVVKVAGQMHPAELSITDEQLDLCRLLVPGFGTPPLKLAAEEAKAGDRIFTIGVNAKGELAATEGTVTQVRATPNGKVLELSTPVTAGSSGGGIFNQQGRLVGLATRQHKFGAKLNIALPVSWIAQMRSRSTPEK